MQIDNTILQCRSELQHRWGYPSLGATACLLWRGCGNLSRMYSKTCGVLPALCLKLCNTHCIQVELDLLSFRNSVMVLDHCQKHSEQTWMQWHFLSLAKTRDVSCRTPRSSVKKQLLGNLSSRRSEGLCMYWSGSHTCCHVKLFSEPGLELANKRKAQCGGPARLLD